MDIEIITALLIRYDSTFPEDSNITSEFITYLENVREESFLKKSDKHLTITCKILDLEIQHELLVKHRKLNQWVSPGGHIEAMDVDLYAAVTREVREETGIEDMHFLTSQIWKLEKHGIREIIASSSCSFHLDVRFVAQVDYDQSVVLSSESVAWHWREIPPQERILIAARLAKIQHYNTFSST